MLSWSKDVNNKNYPNIDINQGEYPDLNLIRLHLKHKPSCIEVASEKGFSDEANPSSVSRIVLNAKRDYLFEITFTGNNFFPIEKKYRFSKSEARLIET